MKEYYINGEEFQKLKNKKIGEGNDAIVYNVGKGKLFKVYKDESNLKDYGKTKIYVKGTKFASKERLCYLDNDGVKIYYKDAFDKIIDRQKYILLSSLPVASLYIDNKFSGCVLNRINGFQLHNVFQLLSKKNKLKILKEIINAVEELTNNYIYPIDTANNPAAGKHSNILLDYKLKPNLIDLDGNSTIYREKYDETEYNNTINSLNLLFLELLNEELIGYELTFLEKEYLKYKLIRKKIDEDLANKLVNFSASYNELYDYAKLSLKIK